MVMVIKLRQLRPWTHQLCAMVMVIKLRQLRQLCVFLRLLQAGPL
jgi:hypothetical protein